jgi:hypothetical protein
MASNRLSLGYTPLFAFGHEKAFSLDGAHDARLGHLFAKAAQKTLL